MRHLDEGTIHAWLDGALDAEQEREAEAHAARCTECAVKVADARGMIAAASRVLTALDDVPGGVLPQGSNAMPPVRSSIASGPRRLPAWTMRVAASIAVVATGTFVVMRSGVMTRAREMDQRANARSELPPGVALKVTPAITPGTSQARNEVQERDSKAPVSVGATDQAVAEAAKPQMQQLADKDSAGYVKTVDSQRARTSLDGAHQLATPAPKNAEGQLSGVGGAAGAPASAPAPASATVAVAPPPRAPAERPQGQTVDSLKVAGADAEAKKDANAAPERLTAQKSKGETGATTATAPPAGGRVSGLVADNLPSGLHLVSQKQTKEDAGVVERRVYELRPGVQVVLAILEPALGGVEARADANSAQRDSVRRKLLAGASGSEEAAGLNSIQWSDSTGAEFTLSGPIPLDSLRALRLRLPTRVQRP